jgi:hypothetical protein
VTDTLALTRRWHRAVVGLGCGARAQHARAVASLRTASEQHSELPVRLGTLEGALEREMAARCAEPR